MTRVRAQGADIRLIATHEATYGTAPASGYRNLLVSRFDPGARKPLGYEPELGLGPEAQDPYYDPTDVRPSFECHARLREMGFWLKGLLGAPGTTGSGTFTHVWNAGAELGSLALEYGHPSLSTAAYYLLTGVKLGTMQIDLARSGPLKLAFTGIGQQESKSGSTVSGSPTGFATGKLFNRDCKLQLGGVDLGQVVGGRINFSNGLEAVETIRGDGLIEGADETERTCDGEVRLRMTAATDFIDAANAETPLALKFVCTTKINAAYKLEIELARAFVDRTSPPINGPAGIEATYAFRAAQTSSSVHLAKFTLINDVASY